MAAPYNDPKLFVMYIGIVFTFCQTHGTLHHRTSQIPWQYLGSEICTTTLFFITKCWGGTKDIVSPLPKRWGYMSPQTPETRSLFVIIRFMTSTLHCYVTDNWMQHKLEIRPSEISTGLQLRKDGLDHHSQILPIGALGRVISKSFFEFCRVLLLWLTKYKVAYIIWDRMRWEEFASSFMNVLCQSIFANFIVGIWYLYFLPFF